MRRTRHSVPAVAALLGAAACLALGGCYEHVTNAGITSTEVKEVHQPNMEEEGPSWINEMMWGEPPKGEDPMKYYRRKNSFGLQN